VQAAGALLDDHNHAEAVARIASSIALARQCLVGARDVVGVLRTGRVDLRTLRSVVDDWTKITGCNARVLLPEGPQELEGAQLIAVSSALRESLTNVSRHSNSREVTVEMSVGVMEVELIVTDAQPDPTFAHLPGTGGGHGLTGLAERAKLLGGTLTAGPHGEGWRLKLILPRTTDTKTGALHNENDYPAGPS